MAVFDAAPQSRQPIIASNLIDENTIRDIENDLELYERLGCWFFLIEDYSSGYKKLLEFDKMERGLSTFIKDNRVSDWQEKVLEALCLLQNHAVLLKLGIKPEDARITFLSNVPEVSFKINKYAKVFYSLFESLSNKDAQKLLNRIYNNNNSYENILLPDTRTWPNEVALELHLLWWIEKGFISVLGDNWSLGNLLRILKDQGMSSSLIFQTLERYNVQDNGNGPYHLDQANNTNAIGSPMRTSTLSHNASSKDYETDELYEVDNGLVLVFNQMKFTGPDYYEERIGSEIDCKLIESTFGKNFGFEIEIYTDSKKSEIVSQLNTLSTRKKKYDCVVVFILSHGTEGNIITYDGLEFPIVDIKSKLCCDALKHKPKILVIQACQPKALTTDGPRRRHRCLDNFEDVLELSSTISGELSVRDRRQGTWFIRILCQTLRDNKGKCIEKCFTKVSRQFQEMSAPIDGVNTKQVPEKRGTLAKTLIFPYKTT